MEDRKKSHLSWVRGLKHVGRNELLGSNGVAPFVGAWIETFLKFQSYLCVDVAPFVGAWIETRCVNKQHRLA